MRKKPKRKIFNDHKTRTANNFNFKNQSKTESDGDM
jgi:hypothetical protein